MARVRLYFTTANFFLFALICAISLGVKFLLYLFMKAKNRYLLLAITLISLVCLIIDLPRFHLNVPFGEKFKINQDFGGYNLDFTLFGKRIFRNLSIRQGLDLKGGLQVIYEADVSSLKEEYRSQALESLRENINHRVDLYGVSEPSIQTSRSGNSYRLIVELPGVEDIDRALEMIGQTANLEFKRQSQELLDYQEKLSNQSETQEELLGFSGEYFVDSGLTGADLAKSVVSFDQQTGKPEVGFEMTPSGGQKLEALTKEIQGQPLAIFLDGQILSAPVVQAVIKDQGRITGNFSLQEAKDLVIQLNAGALPVPVTKISQQNIGATLGGDSVERSLAAGVIGLSLVAFFMFVYYGRLGFLADIGLLVYGLITLALYKLIPVTVTLAGMTGFILSIGMAVDSNILIFERIREELAKETPLNMALKLGFGRGWDDIKDANVCTLIACFVLFNPFDWSFLNTSGLVRGFALTLALGVLVSLFTGVVVTRTLVRVFYRK